MISKQVRKFHTAVLVALMTKHFKKMKFNIKYVLISLVLATVVFLIVYINRLSSIQKITSFIDKMVTEVRIVFFNKSESSTNNIPLPSPENVSGFSSFLSSRPFLLSNNNICFEAQNLSLIILIHSAPTHFGYRNAIRNSWGNYSNYNKSISFRKVFVFGKVNITELQKQLEDEHLTYGDILQGNFIDGYHNLSFSTLHGLFWIFEHCRNARVVMKIDDDVVVDMYNLFRRIIWRYISLTNHVFCNYLSTSIIMRDRNSKWFVDENEMKGIAYYPPYCEGKTVILTSDLVYPILQKAAVTPIFWIEDVFVYGLVLNSQLSPAIDMYTWGNEFSSDCGDDILCVTNDKVCKTVLAELHHNIVAHIEIVWKAFQQRQPSCMTLY